MDDHSSPSNLYLVTFLATLFLLLAVSAAIVLRSYILRRRYHRQIEHALAHGAVFAPRTPGSRKRRLGVRPSIHDRWVAPLVGASRWLDMLPLTVQTVVVKRRTKDPTAFPASDPSPPIRFQPEHDARERRDSTNWRTIISPSPSLAATAPRHSRGLSVPTSHVPVPARLTSAVVSPSSSMSARWRDILSRQDLSPPREPTLPEVSGAPGKYRVRTEMLQISVLVAMPDIRVSALYGDPGVEKRLKAAEIGGWGYRGPSVGRTSGETRRKSQEKREKEIQNAHEDEDEIVEVPGDEFSDDDDDDEEEHVPLPELVLGVTRLNYRHAQSHATPAEERPPPAFVIPSNPPPPPPPAPAPIPVPLAIYDTPKLLPRLTFDVGGQNAALPSNS